MVIKLKIPTQRKNGIPRGIPVLPNKKKIPKLEAKIMKSQFINLMRFTLAAKVPYIGTMNKNSSAWKELV